MSVGRVVTFGLMILAALVALWLDHAMQAFQILLQIGAGTGLIFLLRWFWWRINAWSEIAAMLVSFLLALYLHLGHERLGFAPVDPTAALVIGVGVTTLSWLAVTFLTPPTDRAVLQSFYDRIRPYPAGWRHAVDTSGREDGAATSPHRSSPGFSAASPFTPRCSPPAICSTGVWRSGSSARRLPSPPLTPSAAFIPRVGFWTG